MPLGEAPGVTKEPARPQPVPIALLIRRYVKRCTVWLLLAVVIAWSLAPIYITISSSFKTPLDIFAYPPAFWPTRWTLQNYLSLATTARAFFTGISNSVVITFFSVIYTVSISFPAAYALSRRSSRLLRGAGIGAILHGMFPGIIVTVPLFPILNYLDLQGTKVVLIILYAATQSTVIVWIMKGFLDRIPFEIEEAALVDGASGLKLFRHVLLPLSSPILVTGCILSAVSAWNEYVFALLFTSGSSETAPVIIAGMIADLTGPNWGAILSVSCIQFIPAVIFLILAQRRMIANVTAGAVVG